MDHQHQATRPYPDSPKAARTTSWKAGEWRGRTRHPVASIVNRQNWVHHQSEASQSAQQFPMPERLTGGGKANLPGSSLQQRECSIGLQHSSLLVIAITVDHAMGATERSRCID